MRKVLALPMRQAFCGLALSLFAAPRAVFSAPVFVIEVVDPSVSTQLDDKTSIALNSQDLPGIAYIGSSFPGQVKFARRIGSTWVGSSTAPSEPYKFHFPSLAYDAQDDAHVAYEHEASGVNTGNLRYAVFDGVNWSDGLLINDENKRVGGGASLAVDATGKSHLAFQYEGIGVRYGKRTGGAWTYRTVDVSPTKVISLALDPTSAPAIVFASGSVRFARENAGVWSSTAVTGTANVGSYLSIAFDGVGNAHICYHDATANALKYAISGAGGAWSVSTVEPGGGTHCAITVDPAGIPHISYRSNTPVPGALKYATKTGGTWQITVVDAVAAERTSIAVTDSGIAHISYIASNALRYARQANLVIAVDVQDPGSGQFEWRVQADDGVTGVSGFFRRGGESTYRPMSPFTKQDGTWTSPVASTDVTLRGFDYYLTTEGVASQFGSRENPKRLALSVSGVPGPTPVPIVWRMIAAPMRVDGSANTHSLLTPFFGQVGDRGWKMGRWNPASGSYQTVGVETNVGLESGRAYWLAVTRAAAWSLSGRSALPDRDSCFAVTLEPGWNMVGNPAAYRISLDTSTLQIDDGTTRDTFANHAGNGVVSANIFTYDPALTPPYRTTGAALEAWGGCWIRNTTTPPNTVTLLIPALEAAGPSERPGRASPEHLIRIDALAAGEQTRVEVGIQSGAADDGDSWDIELPPGLPGQAVFLGLIPEVPTESFLLRDVRPPRASGQSWRLTASSREGPLTLEWSAPDDLAVESITLHNGARSWDMRTARSVTLQQGRHDLILVAGPREEPAAGRTAAALRLSPNPFRADGSIQYRLPIAGDVHLAIYDVRGRRVWSESFAGRAAGEHVLIWDARDDRAQPIAAGAYVLVLQAVPHGSDGKDAVRFVQRFIVLQ